MPAKVFRKMSGNGPAMNMAPPLTTVAFLLIREFSMMSVVSGVEPLRAANRLSGIASYDWRFYSDDGAAIAASNGMIVNVAGGLPEIADHLDDIDYESAPPDSSSMISRRIIWPLATFGQRPLRW